MGYRDDFYIVGNIVAYTGDINANPTVYFENLAVRGTEFGRITQDHSDPNNIGRNKVHIKADYRLENRQLVDSVDLCGLVVTHRTTGVEFYDGQDQHTSRNAAIFRVNFGARALPIQAQAIVRFPDEKNK